MNILMEQRTGILKRRWGLSTEKWGTPAVINIDNLDVKPNDLVKVIKNKFALNKKSE